MTLTLSNIIVLMVIDFSNLYQRFASHSLNLWALDLLAMTNSRSAFFLERHYQSNDVSIQSLKIDYLGFQSALVCTFRDSNSTLLTRQEDYLSLGSR